MPNAQYLRTKSVWNGSSFFLYDFSLRFNTIYRSRSTFQTSSLQSANPPFPLSHPEMNVAFAPSIYL